MEENILMDVKDLKASYKTRLGEYVHAVDGVSLTLEKGRSIGIAGESGCGKSTLALSLTGFFHPPLHHMDGSIFLNGRDITKLSPQQMRAEVLGKEISYIPQAAMNALNPTQKVGAFVWDLLSEHIPGITKKDALDLARERFESIRLPERVLRAYPVELSGGMKQRTVIALATLMDPAVLIADEPTSALDVTSQKAVIQLIRNLMEKGVVKSLVFITHELPLLYHVAEKILVMYAGEFVEKGSRDQLVFDPIHPYSKALMSSVMVPEAGSKDAIPAAIPGAPPSLRTPPTGCRFFDRCAYSTEDCREKPGEYLKEGRWHRCIRVEKEELA